MEPMPNEHPSLNQPDETRKEFNNNPLLVKALIFATAIAVFEAVGLTIDYFTINQQKAAITSNDATISSHVQIENLSRATCDAREAAMRAAFGCELPPACVCGEGDK